MSASSPSPLKAGTIVVGDYGYWDADGVYHSSSTPIQSAINSASSGDVILLVGASYTENVEVNKTVTIRGASSHVISPANPSLPTFNISSANSILYDLYVNGGSVAFAVWGNSITLTNNTAIGGDVGFYVAPFNTGNCTLTNNRAFNSTTTGYQVWGPNNTLIGNNATWCNYSFSVYNDNTLIGNLADQCEHGFFLYQGSSTLTNNTAIGGDVGFYVWPFNTGNCTLTNNRAFNSTYAGYYISSINNTLNSNEASWGAGVGFFLNQSINNTVTMNYASGNSGGGVRLENCSGNALTWNDFINPLNSYDDSLNLWDWNYFSDYSGVDRDGDGAGDTPYSVPGGSNIDLHPRIHDNDLPTVVSVLPANGSFHPYVSTISAQYFDTTSNVNSSLCRLILDNVDVTLNASFATYNMSFSGTLGEGTHSVRMYLEDFYGNAMWHNWSFGVDATPPSIHPLSPTNGTLVADSTPALCFGYSDSLSGISPLSVRLFLDGVNVTSSASINGTIACYLPSSPLSDGSHNATISVADAVGNNASSTVFFTVDATPPSISLISPTNSAYPSTPLINSSVTDALSGVHTVLAEIDGSYNLTLALAGGFYTALLDLPDGHHYVRIIANDTVGNTASSPSVHFTVDTTPPSIAIAYPQNLTYGCSSMKINALVSDALSPVHTVLAEIDGSYNLTLVLDDDFYVSADVELADGVHRVRVIANDTLGNVDSTTLVHFTVDTTPPSIDINHPIPSSLYYGSAEMLINASVSDALSGVQTVIAELNGAQNVTLLPEGAFFVSKVTLAEGNYTLMIIANDTVGNTAQADYCGVFYIDLTPPSIAVEAPANATYASNQITINASAYDPISGTHTVIAEVDGSHNYTMLVSSPHYTALLDLPDGHHYVRIIANDTVGNTASSPSVHFTVDTTPPSVTINAPSDSAVYASSEVLINVTATDNLSAIHAVVAELNGVQNVTLLPDGTAFVGSCSLSDGAHVIRIYANDTAGNTNSTQSVSFAIDTAPPSVSIISPANGSSYPFLPKISVVADDALSGVHTVLAEIDGSYNLTLALAGGFYTALLDLPDGHHYVRIIANDTVGNTAVESSAFLLDASPPTLTVTSPSPASCSGNSSVTISATFSDGVSAVSVASISLDGTELRPSASVTATDLSIEVALSDGQHDLSITVTDALGNFATASFRFCVDTCPPVLASSSHENGTFVRDQNVTIDFAFQDAVSGVDGSTASASIDGYPAALDVEETPGGANLSLSALLDEGEHLIEVSVADAAGNRATAALRITVDLSPPQVVALQPEAGTVVSGFSVISAEFIDDHGVDPRSVRVFVDGLDLTTFCFASPSGFSLNTVLPDGEHHVRVAAGDLAGNIVYEEWSFTIDATPPYVSILSPLNNTATNNTPLISFSFHDSVSGINASSASLFLDGADLTQYANISSSAISYAPSLPLSEGMHQVLFEISDLAGNTKSVMVAFAVDTIPPARPTSALSNYSAVSAGHFQFTASLPGEATPVNLSLYVDGVDCTPSAVVEGDRIVCTIDLTEGIHSITLEVEDAAGNAASSTWIVNAVSPTFGSGLGQLAIAAAVVVAAAMGAVALLRLRHKK
ncbi:MAG: Ig-like domain-containing protein [Candidatus Methanosuratincola petrocarbonis]